jgi:hypothetical protein
MPSDDEYSSNKEDVAIPMVMSDSDDDEDNDNLFGGELLPIILMIATIYDNERSAVYARD